MRALRIGAAIAAVAAGTSLIAWGSLSRAQEGGDAARGQEVFSFWCAPCHAPGPGHPGTESLAVKYGDALPAEIEDREDLTPEAVRLFVRQGVLSMPPFRKTEIGDADLDALAAYLGDAPAE